MIPEFSHSEQFQGYKFWITTDSRCGILLKLDAIDSEKFQFTKNFETISSWAKRQDPQTLVRFIFDSKQSSDLNLGTSRDQSISEIGFTENKIIVSIETHGPPSILRAIQRLKSRNALSFENSFSRLISSIEGLKTLGINFKLFDDFENSEVFAKNIKSWVVCESVIDSGPEYLACVRLIKPNFSEVETEALQKLIIDLPKPFSIQTSFQRQSSAETQIMVSRRIKQSASATDSVNQEKLSALEEIASKTSIEGDSLFSMEVLLTLRRTDLAQLKNDLSIFKNGLERLGEPIIETFGSLPSIGASMIGSPQHIGFLETGTNLPYYLPLFAKGCSRLRASGSSSLVVHRQDNSVDQIDLLSNDHQNANAVVVGASGRGKSAFVGTLTQALLNCPNTRVIKVDVGGSHSKECSLFGGTEHKIALDRPSGINPFSVIKNSENNEAIRSVLNNFLSVLVLEENETNLPKTTRVEIDQLLKNFIASKPMNPSLDSFYQSMNSFSRERLLSRWCKGGIFAKAFEPNLDQTESRLSYYNFSEIFQAADPDFAQAGMAAVLARFNLEMQLHRDKRIILICDETPFFIQKCFEFFKFSTANVRKFGASVILIVQMSRDLIAKNDPGIIENSFHRILLSVDGDSNDYQSRFKLRPDQIQAIQSLQTKPREFSELYYQFGDQGFKGRLKLTAEEYFQITTNQTEKIQIDRLLVNVPGLTLKEAISCLAI